MAVGSGIRALGQVHLLVTVRPPCQAVLMPPLRGRGHGRGAVRTECGVHGRHFRSGSAQTAASSRILPLPLFPFSDGHLMSVTDPPQNQFVGGHVDQGGGPIHTDKSLSIMYFPCQQTLFPPQVCAYWPLVFCVYGRATPAP